MSFSPLQNCADKTFWLQRDRKGMETVFKRVTQAELIIPPSASRHSTVQSARICRNGKALAGPGS